jgi:predicted nucleic acid-binding protein
VIDPASGPFLFDTSAESWLMRSQVPGISEWVCEYLSRFRIHVSAITVIERIRGYSLLWRRADAAQRDRIEASRVAYLSALGQVSPVDRAIAAVAGEIMALVPDPPTPPKRTHAAAESRAERLSRWRFDCTIAATALVAGLTLIHNNAADFELIRGSIEKAPGRFPGLGSLELIRCQRIAQTER